MMNLDLKLFTENVFNLLQIKSILLLNSLLFKTILLLPPKVIIIYY
jgi:hypothetical protein